VSKPFRVSGPVLSHGPVTPGETCRTIFTPQTRTVFDGCLLPRGWEVVSLRRVPVAELEIGGAVHGQRCEPFTVTPRPAIDIAYHCDPRDDSYSMLCAENAEVGLTEALEMVVRNVGGEARQFKSWWVGTVEKKS